MSINSINSTEPITSSKIQSYNRFFPPSIRSQKSATLSSIQLSQATQQQSLSVNADDPKHIIYPSPALGYQPKKCPPDLSVALKHRIAHGVAPLDSLLTTTETCESTGVPFTTRKLPLCAKANQFYHLGPVFPMYFLLIKQISVIMSFLCILAIAVGLLQFQSDAKPSSYVDYISILYKNELQTTILVMGSLCILLTLFFLLYKFRKQQKVTKMNCKGGNLSSSDYTIMSSNLADTFNDEELKSFFSNFIVSGYSLDVVKVTKTYDIDKYISAIRKLSSFVNKRQEKVARRKETESASEIMKLEDIDKEIEEIKHFFIRRKTFLMNFQLLRKNDICFITFNTRQEAKAVKRRFELSPVQSFFTRLHQCFSKDLSEYYLNKKFVKIQKAPEPTEILWENLCKPKQSIWFTFVYILLCAAIFTITAFSLWKLCNTDSSFNGWLIGFTIAITNELLYCVVSGLALWKNFITITEKHIDLTYKLVFLQMINMVVPIYVLDLTEPTFSPTGLPLYLLCIAVVSFALPIFIHLIYPKALMKSILRVRAQLQGPKCPLNQEQANQLFEDPELNISVLYSTILKILMFSCFCFSISPGVAFVALIALILVYWIDKYNLFRRSLIPSYMRSELAEAMNECLEISLVLLALGNLVWSLMMFRNINSFDDSLTIMMGSSVFELLLTTIYLVLPNKKICREWSPTPKKEPSWSSNLFYQQAAEYFPSNYDLCSPLAELNNQPQEIKQKYKKTLQKFSCIEALADCPEILPMFEYADSHPTFFRSWVEGLQGSKYPYYIYPQNYGYGLVQLIAQNNNIQSGNKIPLLQGTEIQRARKKGANTAHIPVASAFAKKPNDISPLQAKRETRDFLNLMTEMVSTAHEIGSARQKASTISSQEDENNNTQSEGNRKKQNSDANNTMIFGSLRNEVILGQKEDAAQDNSIIGISPIIGNDLLKHAEKR